jgi:hypothetical protein
MAGPAHGITIVPVFDKSIRVQMNSADVESCINSAGPSITGCSPTT